ncbi:hypothetical protein J7L05_11255 [bacterium]|nr:hypothetical protein [bacterium]
MKLRLPIILLAIIAFANTYAYAETSAITELQVSVDRDGTSISVNVPADFTYLENPENNEIEIIFENCTVRFRGHDYIRIPSFSPMFESIEIARNVDTNSSSLKIKLTNNIIKPAISVMPSENRLVFSFYPPAQTEHAIVEPIILYECLNITSEDDVSEIADSQTQFNESLPVCLDDDATITGNVVDGPEFPTVDTPAPIVQIPKVEPVEDEQEEHTSEVEPSELHVDEIIEEVETVEEAVETKQVQKEIELYKAPNESFLADEFPLATLEAIHYSQGRVDRDVITLEFSDVSPRFHYEINSSGCAVLTLHNLVTPEEILPGDEIKRSVRGTIIKSISLMRFDEMNLPALQIMLVGKESISIEIEDLKGMLEIVLRAGGE